jgi:hypothetical protein
MTDKELMSLDSQRVRHDENLMRLYIDLFRRIFYREPNCAGCTFSDDWRKLKAHITTPEIQGTNLNTMSNITFEIVGTNRNKIHRFVDSKGKVHRAYGWSMTEDFAQKFLASAKDEEELAQRKRIFKVLPSESLENPAEATQTVGGVTFSGALADQSRAKLEEIAQGVGIEETGKSAFKNKSLLVEAINAKTAEPND